MLQISEKQWNKVQDLYKEKLSQIDDLEKECKDLSLQLQFKNSAESGKLETLRMENDKLRKENIAQEYTMRTILDQLNVALNMVEARQLRQLNKVSVDDLLDITI